ncbi:Fis family transcriptional regulator [Candidatus Nitrosoglobus terrae]|uniref:Putative Fis-like DNA-binding protein n=1 Tax=Candidatus Nitrosoglobus terrae TaxID=1630141 RepID=A0A1Q2SK49_9GAMM|nr:DNA-binding transcriptional regulator Fis [Candidatus Nitrosoglobus terrae]BAW79498.1 Fis family transcriptional regulator [Candidatus Nitrosoglobus terrae]
MSNKLTQIESYKTSFNEEQQHSSIKECLRQMLNEYFEHLDGHNPNDLYGIVIREIEPPLLEITLKYAGGNQTKAAKFLGMNRSTLRKKLKQYNISSIN